MTLNDIINTCCTIGQLSGFSTQLLGPKETNGRQDRRLRCSSSLSGCVGQVFPLRHGRLGWQKLDSQNWTWEYTDHITLATHHFGIYLNRWFMFIPYCTWILESTVKQLWEISKMLVILWCHSHSHRRCLSCLWACSMAVFLAGCILAIPSLRLANKHKRGCTSTF